VANVLPLTATAELGAFCAQFLETPLAKPRQAAAV
jgi:hypothetical protein